MRNYGVADDTLTEHTQLIDVYSGAYMSDHEASGRVRTGAKQFTLTVTSGEKVIVRLPAGITGPRTEHNFADFDKAVNAALNDYYFNE